MLSGCKNKHNESNIYVYDEVNELFAPIWIEPGENIISISDYFYDVSKVDSVSFQYPEFVKYVDNEKIILDIDYTKTRSLSELIFWVNGYPYSLLCKERRLIETSISFEPGHYKHYNKVQIAGDWNNWNPESCEMNFEGYIWRKEIFLSPGKYQFQIVADGKWMTNPKYKDSVPNGFGAYNSIKEVKWKHEDPFYISAESFNEKEILIHSTGALNEYFMLWQNKRIPINLSELNDLDYNLTIPEEAFHTDFSYLRIYGFTKEGITNDLLIPLYQGKVITDPSLLTRNQKQTQIMYFTLIDRFYNGNKENDKPVNDAEVAFRANYQGGDIEGIIQKLDEGYFDSLGINTLWLSPVMTNPLDAYREYPEPKRKYSGYHGYWPISSTEVDPRLGSSESLKQLIEDAHSKNKNIVLDFVANHVHELHPLYQSHPEWATDLILEDGTKNIRIWDEQRLTTWFDTFLPSWDFSIEAVRDTISEYAMYWLNTYNIDGFRHDATKHIPEEFWQLLTKKIKASGKSVYQVGETFGNRDLIGSYVTTGMLDAQFDFNLYFDARYTFASDSAPFQTLGSSLSASLDAYGAHHLMGNISGNHDLPRFTSLASGDLSFEEDDKEAGWSRNIEITNPIGYKRMQLLMSFLFTIPGVPCIYYGDEIGMAGAGDPDNRRMMIFNDLNEYQIELFLTTQKLAKLRRNSMALLYGETRIVEINKTLIAYQRKYFDEVVIVIINKAPYRQVSSILLQHLPQDLNFKALHNTKFSYDDFHLSMELPPYSFEILTTGTL